MRNITIYRRIFYNADCYTRGTYQTNFGVQVHSTGAPNSYLKRYVQPDDGRLGYNKNNNSHNRPGGTVCAGAYIGKLQDGTVAVYETLPENMRVWLSGNGPNGNANRLGYFGFEVCEDNLTDESYFREAVLNIAVLYTAYLCQQYGAQPGKLVNGRLPVMDHSELHRAGLASNHGDITTWLKKFGYTMNDFRRLVCEALDDGVEATIVDVEGRRTIRKGDSGDDVRQAQIDLNSIGYNVGNADGIFGQKTYVAVKEFQTYYGLYADGIIGAKTWAKLDEAVGRNTDEKEEEKEEDECEKLPFEPDDKDETEDIIPQLRDILDSVNDAKDDVEALIKKLEGNA